MPLSLNDPRHYIQGFRPKWFESNLVIRRHFADKLPVTRWYWGVLAWRYTSYSSYQMGLNGMQWQDNTGTQNSKTNGATRISSTLIFGTTLLITSAPQTTEVLVSDTPRWNLGNRYGPNIRRSCELQSTIEIGLDKQLIWKHSPNIRYDTHKLQRNWLANEF